MHVVAPGVFRRKDQRGLKVWHESRRNLESMDMKLVSSEEPIAIRSLRRRSKLMSPRGFRTLNVRTTPPTAALMFDGGLNRHYPPLIVHFFSYYSNDVIRRVPKFDECNCLRMRASSRRHTDKEW